LVFLCINFYGKKPDSRSVVSVVDILTNAPPRDFRKFEDSIKFYKFYFEINDIQKFAFELAILECTQPRNFIIASDTEQTAD